MSFKGDGSSLTVEDVEKETTYMGLLKMFRLLAIQPPDVNAQVLKEILVSHLQAKKQGQATNFDMWDIIPPSDSTNRFELKEFFHRATLFIKQLPDVFKADLNGIFPGFYRNMLTTVDELKSSHRILLVAGEVSSGKSGLINLMLGSAILPTSDLQCTASIVEISFGDLPSARMHFKADEHGVTPKPLTILSRDKTASAAFKKELEDHITKRDLELDESPYERIELFWPLEFLRGGLTIVDTPGVGETPKLLDQLAHYTKHALGIIYVIDSTSVINKHRLGQLLLKAMEADGNFFAPDTALFVCNRWDMVPPEDSDKVKASLGEKISMVVPGIKMSQLIPMSVKKSLVAMEYEHTSPEHRLLIDNLRRLLPRNLKTKLRIYYRYLSSILKRSLYCLRISYYTSTRTLDDMHRDVESREERLTRLQSDGENKLAEMRRQVKMLTVEAAGQILDLLASQEVRDRLTTWPGSQCPAKTKWREEIKAASSLISIRVAEEINQWGRASHFEDKITNDIVKKFEEKYELLSTEVQEVQAVFLSNEEQNTVRDLHNSMRSRKDRAREISIPADSAERDHFLSLGNAVGSAIDLEDNADVVNLFKDKFDKNPSHVMESVTELSLKSLTLPVMISALNKYFHRFVKGVDEVGKLVPSMLKADQTLLKEMSRKLHVQESGLKYYPLLCQKCENIQGNMDMFFVGKLMESDFLKDQLHKKEVIGRGTFATVYRAVLSNGTESKVVALKEPRTYLNLEDVSNMLLEESILREVQHENIIQYFGMCHYTSSQGRVRLDMVMEYCPLTLKRKYIVDYTEAPATHKDSKRKQAKAIEKLTHLLVQVITGLVYLHEKGIVHRDLKPDNVLLTDDDTVKIADLGFAKNVKEIATQAIGTPVYIAPEVLLFGGKYNTKADIYSFGMITWELWYGTDLAEYAARELPGDLEESIEKKWRPDVTLASAPSHFWKSLITVCWDQEPKRRPRTKDIRAMLLSVQSEIQKATRK